MTTVYNPKAFIPHAASLRQACAHCGGFSTAASRRSLGSVSVPVWPVTLSGRLPVIAMVSHYLTIKLIGHRPVPNHKHSRGQLYLKKNAPQEAYPVLAEVSPSYPDSRGLVVYALLTLSPPNLTEVSSVDLHA